MDEHAFSIGPPMYSYCLSCFGSGVAFDRHEDAWEHARRCGHGQVPDVAFCDRPKDDERGFTVKSVSGSTITFE